MRFEGIIFDFDGVLVDSEPLHEWAILSSVADRGWSFDRQQFFEHIVGKGDEHAYHKIAEWHGQTLSPGAIDTLLRRKWALMEQGISEGRFTVQAGAIELVRSAAVRGPVGLCSGSVAGTVRPMLERLGVLESFGSIVTGDQVARNKPDPEGYLLATRRLGVEPARCIAIEDTPTGVQAARSAGMHVVAVGHTVPLEMLTHANEVVPHISHLRVDELLGPAPR